MFFWLVGANFGFIFSFLKKENNAWVIGRRQGLLPSAWSSSGGVARQVSTRGRAGFARWQSRQ